MLIPGVVTHSTNVVEHPELVSWRIQNYASVVGRDRVIAGSPKNSISEGYQTTAGTA